MFILYGVKMVFLIKIYDTQTPPLLYRHPPYDNQTPLSQSSLVRNLSTPKCNRLPKILNTTPKSSDDNYIDNTKHSLHLQRLLSDSISAAAFFTVFTSLSCALSIDRTQPNPSLRLFL